MYTLQAVFYYFCRYSTYMYCGVNECLIIIAFSQTGFISLLGRLCIYTVHIFELCTLDGVREQLNNTYMWGAPLFIQENYFCLFVGVTQSAVMQVDRACWLISCSYVANTLHLPEKVCIRRNDLTASRISHLFSFYFFKQCIFGHNIMSELWRN